MTEAPKGRLARTDEFMKIEEGLEEHLSDLRKRGIFTHVNSIIKTKDEIEAGNLLLLDMTEDGVILFDRDDFMENILRKWREKLRHLGAKRIWKGNSWYWLLKPDLTEGEKIEL